MSIVARMQLAIAVIEQFGFESVGSVRVEGDCAEILLFENAEFYKAAPTFIEIPVEGHDTLVARMETKVNGVLLIAYKHRGEMETAS